MVNLGVNLTFLVFSFFSPWSFNSYAQAQPDLSRLNQILRQETVEILKSAPPVSGTELQLIWKTIDTHYNNLSFRILQKTGIRNIDKFSVKVAKYLTQSEPFSDKGSGIEHKMAMSLIYEKDFLKMAFEALVHKQRIRKLTPGVRQSLGIPNQICKTKDQCHDLMGVYLPISNMILVDYTILDKEAISRFYHELFHAVQYMYRYPMDIGMIFDLTRDDENEKDNLKLEINEINDFLSFYYEAIANWKTLQFTRDQEWLKIRNSKSYLTVVGLLKALTNVLSFQKLRDLSGESAKKWLSQQYIDEFIDNVNVGVYLSDEAFLDMPDLFVIKDLNHLFTLQSNLNFAFHLTFTKALEKAYFGDTSFLKRRNNGDQIIFSRLHDDCYLNTLRIYSSLHEFAATQKCWEALNKIVYYQDSPLIGWFSASPSELLACSHYKKTSFWRARDFLLELYLNFNDHFFYGGTRGAGGPMLRIQPQLIIKPPKD